MTSGLYLIRITKPLAYLDERNRVQIASFNADIGKRGRFYINRGAAGGISISPRSVEVIGRATSLPLVLLHAR